jgi:hypothetical protein
MAKHLFDKKSGIIFSRSWFARFIFRDKRVKKLVLWNNRYLSTILCQILQYQSCFSNREKKKFSVKDPININDCRQHLDCTFDMICLLMAIYNR